MVRCSPRKEPPQLRSPPERSYRRPGALSTPRQRPRVLGERPSQPPGSGCCGPPLRRHPFARCDWRRRSPCPADPGEPAPLTSRRKFVVAAATRGAGLLSAGPVPMIVHRSAIKLDRRRNLMESPIEVVRRFCAAWSKNLGADELAAFFTDVAVYHISRWRRSPAGRPSRTRSPRSSALARQASRASSSASSTSQPMVRS